MASSADGQRVEILCEVTNTGPVCGTDDVTYGNECNLRVTAAMLNLDIDVQYEGRCKPVRRTSSDAVHYTT